MTDTLSALDATFLELEQLNPAALMSIGGVMVFEPPADRKAPTADDLRASLAASIDALPRYSQRLSSLHAGGLSWPQWETDPQFEVGNHVRHAALPAPGREQELCDWTADFFSHPLDRARPLWELVLLEGLADGRWALAHKVHHCMVDGVGSVDVVGLLLDDQPAPGRSREARHEDGHEVRARLPHPPAAITQATRAGAHAAEAAVHAALHPREALDRSRALASLFVQAGLLGAPHTSLNVPIGQTRRFAVVRASLAELKGIGYQLGGSLNDVMLAACAGGLRALMIERDEELPARGVRAMVPVNVRTKSEEHSLGNRVSSLFVDLPVAEPVPAARFRKIAASTRHLKANGAARGPTTMIDLAELAPPLVTAAALARTSFSTRLFNVTITNVPGSQEPLYAFGSQMREVYPVVPLAAEHAVGVAIFSYNGMVSIGINADCDSMPDLRVMADGIDESLEELRNLAESGAAV